MQVAVAHVPYPVTVGIILIGVGDIRAVVAGITDAVAIGIQLIGIGYTRTIVVGRTGIARIAGITDTVEIAVDTVIACIANIVMVDISLIGIGHIGTVIAEITPAVTVGIGAAGAGPACELVVDPTVHTSCLLRCEFRPARFSRITHEIVAICRSPGKPGADIRCGYFSAIVVSRCRPGVGAEVAGIVSVGAIGGFVARSANFHFTHAMECVPQPQTMPDLVTDDVLYPHEVRHRQHNTATGGQRAAVPRESAEGITTFDVGDEYIQLLVRVDGVEVLHRVHFTVCQRTVAAVIDIAPFIGEIDVIWSVVLI